tara:strand:- start:29143 stop:29346 length:204 start_codon:yes stop_codon:yes gene_type:complete
MKLRIMNDTGHTELVDVSATQMVEQITDHPTHWVYVDGEMVTREAIGNIAWDEVDNVNLVPAIVGGC